MRALADTGKPGAAARRADRARLPRAVRRTSAPSRRAVRGGADADRPARPARFGAGAVRLSSPSAGTARANPGAPSGDEIPLPVRIAHVARDAAFQRMLGGEEFAARVVRERAGARIRSGDSRAARGRCRTTILALDGEASAWDETLACEPTPRLILEGEAIDRALAAMGDFADLVSPYLVGHSAGVAELASAAAQRCGSPPPTWWRFGARRSSTTSGASRSRPASGRRPAPLTPDEWERVRLHAYHSERVLCRSPFLAALAPVATAHHERLDGSGYHRGSDGRRAPAAGPPARRRRRVPRDDRAAAAPRGALAASGPPRRSAGGSRRTTGRRRGRRGARGGRPSRSRASSGRRG